jgi:TonB family protein
MKAAVIGGDLVGRVIDGRFTLLKRLGKSEAGGVFLTALGDRSQKAVIKLLPADQEDAEIRMSAWEAATKLSHPNLMQVFASGRCEVDSVAFVYAVEEYADEVLAEILPERALTPLEAREMLSPALDALCYLRGKGFVHGELKPKNIMAVGERLKLSADGLTIINGAFGKPSFERTVYDAPETARGAIGTAADVWSLGATMVEVLTQHPPAWDGMASSEPVVPAAVPQPFAGLARECLRIDPKRRCTLEEIKGQLAPKADQPRAHAEERGEEPAVINYRYAEEQREEREEKSAVTKRRVAVSIGAVVALLATFAIWRAQSHHEETPAPTAQNPPAASSAPSDSDSAPAPSPDSGTAAPQPSASAAGPAPEANQASPAARPSSGTATVKGAAAQQVQPDVAASAMSTISGTVKVAVRLAVDANGNVTNAEFESAGPSRYFANKALEAARQWKFKPAEADGQAAASAWILHFEFRQSGVNITPEETEP